HSGIVPVIEHLGKIQVVQIVRSDEKVSDTPVAPNNAFSLRIDLQKQLIIFMFFIPETRIFLGKMVISPYFVPLRSSQFEILLFYLFIKLIKTFIGRHFKNLFKGNIFRSNRCPLLLES